MPTDCVAPGVLCVVCVHVCRWNIGGRGGVKWKVLGKRNLQNQTNITFSRVHVYKIFCLPQNLVPFSHHPIPISHQLSCLRKILFMMTMRGGVRVLV